jgi:DNA-binding LacI/PurR family transcriptional regulator
MTAIGIMNTLQQRGFSIPQDFSVVGFDDLDIAAYCHPRLTTIQQPVYQLGYRATKMLFQRIQGNNDLQLEVIEPELIVRDSTAPVGVPVGGVLNLSKG